METAIRLLKNEITRAIFLFSALGLIGCATTQKGGSFRPKPGSQSEQVPPSEIKSGDLTPSGETQNQEVLEATPPEVRTKPIVLVLGPGLAKGFSYAGVFEALHEAKIPIAAIFGTEMGAFIGALYAANPQINAFEWSIFQLNEGLFKDPSGFFRRFKSEASNGEKFEDYLKQVFGNKKIQDLPIPLRIAIQSRDMKIPVVLDSGNLAEAIRAAMAAPQVFTASSLHSQGDTTFFISATTTRPFLVSEAKKLNLGPVIVINALSKSESLGAKDELKLADLVLSVNTRGIGYLDYAKKADASYQGKELILHSLPILRHLMEQVGPADERMLPSEKSADRLDVESGRDH